MKTTYLLIDLAMYLGVVPCLIALLNKNRLSRAMWCLWAHLVVGVLLGIIAIVLADRGINNHFIYPVMATLTSIAMGLFFAELVQNQRVKWIIRLVFATYAGYVSLTGFGRIPLLLNLELFAPLDIMVFGLSLFFLLNLLRHSHRVAKKPLFWLLLALCLGALYDMAVMQLGTLLTQYGGNRWLDLFWLQINPVVTMVKHGLYSYGFYLTRFQLIKSEKLPQFTV